MPAYIPMHFHVYDWGPSSFLRFVGIVNFKLYLVYKKGSLWLCHVCYSINDLESLYEDRCLLL